MLMTILTLIVIDKQTQIGLMLLAAIFCLYHLHVSVLRTCGASLLGRTLTLTLYIALAWLLVFRDQSSYFLLP